MDTTLYKLLNDHSKEWWYHRELRKRGQEDEARRRERQSIKGWVDNIRQAVVNGGFVHIGHHGMLFHYSPDARVTVAWPEEYMVSIARIASLPIIDSRTIPDKDITKTIRFPMAVVNTARKDPEPYNSLSFAPIAYVAKLYQGIGATVENVA